MSLALEHYDRHLPLLQGQVQPQDIDLKVEHVSVDQGRHERMLASPPYRFSPGGYSASLRCTSLPARG